MGYNDPVTWAFLYLMSLLAGLILAAGTGMLRGLPHLSPSRHLTVPVPEQHYGHLNLLGRRLSTGLAIFGLTGLVLGAWERMRSDTIAEVAVAAGVAAFALTFLLVRGACAIAAATERAIVVRTLPPGGYGQVRLESEGRVVTLAAKSVDDEEIPAGSEVSVVDCTRSVITVRRPEPASSPS